MYKSNYHLLRLVLLSFLICGLSRAQSTINPSGADSIVFLDGDVLTGTVSKATTTALLFSNKAVGSLTIQWSDLQSVHLSRPSTISEGIEGSAKHTIGSADLKVSTSPSALALTISPTNGSPIVVISDVKSIDINNAVSPAPQCGGVNGPCSGWSVVAFKVNTATLLATQKQQTYGAELDLLGNWKPKQQGWPHQRTLVQLIPNYSDTRKNAKVGSATVTQEYEGSIQHLAFISSNNLFATLIADEYRNNSLGLYFQQSYGLGIGGIFHDIELNADLRFIGQHFYAPYASTELAGSQLSERYMIPLNFLKVGASISETGIIIPVFNESRAWQVKGIIDISIPLTSTIQFTLTDSDYYVENTPDAYHKNYFKNTIGIQYTPATKK